MSNEFVRLWCIKADNDLKAGKDELQTQNPATDTEKVREFVLSKVTIS
jgi:hypothetical protein